MRVKLEDGRIVILKNLRYCVTHVQILKDLQTCTPSLRLEAELNGNPMLVPVLLIKLDRPSLQLLNPGNGG